MFTKYGFVFTFLLLRVIATAHKHDNTDNDNKSKDDKNIEKQVMPTNWPSQWDAGIIPFGYDYFSANPKTFIKIVRKGLDIIRHHACLNFKEHNPIHLAQLENFTYLYFSYSGVLEDCCATFFSKDIGRRLVLITPKCRNPVEVAHATLHALGLAHEKHQRFHQAAVKAVLYPEECMTHAFDKNSSSDQPVYSQSISTNSEDS